MKKLIFPFFIMLFISPSIIFAQLPNTTYITPYAGLSMPTNQDTYRTSFNTGVNIEFALSKLAAFGVDLNFANLSSRPSNEGVYTLVIGAITSYDYGNLSTMGMMAFFKLQNADAIKMPVQPFVKVGIGASLIAKTGLNYSSFSTITSIPSETSTGFLFAPSLGMNIPVNLKNKIVLEAQFRINKSSTQNVNSFLMNFGYSFRL